MEELPEQHEAPEQNPDGTVAAADVPLRERSYFPVLYMFVVTLFFSAIVIGIARATQTLVRANQKVMFEKAMLEATLPRRVPADVPVSEAHSLFVEYAKLPNESSGGAYRIMVDGELVAYGLPFEGRGYWDVVKGVVGLSLDGSKLIGVSFYQQKETPGLGAEIVKQSFRRQFEGLRLGAGDTPLAIVSGGSGLRDHEVEAVTGATQTCSRVERIINAALARWRRQTNHEPVAEEKPET